MKPRGNSLIGVGCIVVFCMGLPCAYAQTTLRERIRENWLKKKQAYDTAGAREYHLTLLHGGLTRNYDVYIPATYKKNNATPVVIYLHGGGGSMKAAYQDGLDKASDEYGFILVIPAGTGILPDRLLTWNAGTWSGGECCGPSVRKGIDDVGFINKMIEALKEKFNVDKNRIYATGISNGAMMSYRLACELSDTIAAVAAVAPPAIPQNCTPARPISIMHIIGSEDPCVPIKGGVSGGCLGKTTFTAQSAQEMADTWRTINGCSENTTMTYQNGSATCLTYGPCSSGQEVVFCTIEGGGHTWPSGHQYMPAEKVGPVSYDMSFNQIWEFFKRHPKE